VDVITGPSKYVDNIWHQNLSKCTIWLIFNDKH
jgi:hypothetical protein